MRGRPIGRVHNRFGTVQLLQSRSLYYAGRTGPFRLLFLYVMFGGKNLQLVQVGR